MTHPNPHNLPHTLSEGTRYLYLDQSSPAVDQPATSVQFIAHTSCPAIVVILDGDGRRVRCKRECLFEAGADGQCDFVK